MKRILGTVTLSFLFATTAYAQQGCVNSPECSTAILAAVGAAAFCIRYQHKK